MSSLAKTAALKEVRRLESRMRDRLVTAGNPEQIMEWFKKDLAAVEALVQEHHLEGSVLSDFRNRMAKAIYETADKRQWHAWQATFAKEWEL